MLIIGQITWAVIFYGYYLDGSHLALQITFAIITSFLLILNVFINLPTTFLIYTTITNIEMMKDRELIKTTIANQREVFQQALIKFYRLIKARRRKSLIPEDEDEIVLKAFNVTLIHEAFTQINVNYTEALLNNPFGSLMIYRLKLRIYQHLLIYAERILKMMK